MIEFDVGGKKTCKSLSRQVGIRHLSLHKQGDKWS